MNCWIFLDVDSKEEIDRETVNSPLELDLLNIGDQYVCVNNFTYIVVGAYKILNARKGRLDKYLLCTKQTSDSERERKTI